MLYSHQTRFFRSFGCFLGGGFDCFLLLLLPVEFFRMEQLLVSLRQNRARVFVTGCDMRDANRIARFEQFQRSLWIDSENRILNVRVRR